MQGLRVWFLAIRAAAGLSVVFIATMGLIRAQPYDDRDVRLFLLPPAGCPSPCFLGVRPGITPGAEAIRILEANGWIDAVVQTADFYDLHWSGARPTFVDTNAMNYLFAPSQRIGWIRLTTRMRLGDVILTLGHPEATFSRMTRAGQSVYQNLIYRQFGLQVSTLIPCPIDRIALWEHPVEIRMERRLTDFALAGFSLTESLHSAC